MEPASDAKARQALGRVVDPADLDAAGARRARASLSVPEGWLLEPSRIRFTLPRRLGCDVCEGGGCGACGNRGGFVVPEGLDREVSLSLAGGAERMRVRVVPDFAALAGFDVLLVDIQRGEPSLGARRLDLMIPTAAQGQPSVDAKLMLLALLSLALFVAVALAVLR